MYTLLYTVGERHAGLCTPLLYTLGYAREAYIPPWVYHRVYLRLHLRVYLRVCITVVIPWVYLRVCITVVIPRVYLRVCT